MWKQIIEPGHPCRFQIIITPSVRVKPQPEFIEDLEQLASEGCKGQHMSPSRVCVRHMNRRGWRVEEDNSRSKLFERLADKAERGRCGDSRGPPCGDVGYFVMHSTYCWPVRLEKALYRKMNGLHGNK
jgi:hypothetical protein